MIENIPLSRPGHRALPEGLEFLCLARSRGGEALRLRFRRDVDRRVVVDLPVSAETIARLVQELSLFRDVIPQDVPDAIANFQQMGGRIEE
jgi:hypothetical protein